MTHKPITDAEAKNLDEACERVRVQPDRQENLIAKIWTEHCRRLLADRKVAMEMIEELVERLESLVVGRAILPASDEIYVKEDIKEARALIAAVKGGE